MIKLGILGILTVPFRLYFEPNGLRICAVRKNKL